MTTQIVPLESLQKIQKFLQVALTLPAAEQNPKLMPVATGNVPPPPTSLADLGDLFRMGSCLEDGVSLPNDQGHWFLSMVDPATTINRLPGLSIKPDYRFATYLYRLREIGIGHTVALSESMASTAQLESALHHADKPDYPPQPVGTLPDCMAAITGDQTPMSFMVASILRRELQEFGCLGEPQQNWRRHRCIAAAPTQARWQWRTEAAPDLRPRIRLLPHDQMIVEFFSCRVHPSIAIFQHLDQYKKGSYVAQSIDRPLAFAEQKAS
ncbi:hypothetical protein IQ266_22360 [filamentous cyanobacterium LEGE 11480]|uniref:Uncharacterized protein n=1 Tax=Romeriopsis navalis LEGE 11480 TaxID=2777977 RepID=A0A928VTV2_9CYAN|nr:hypothetical protein [Romeriopsis navalis]MBE9032485.1 hypothetical protein [Romeriopsis navalis LEGE 11480]